MKKFLLLLCGFSVCVINTQEPRIKLYAFYTPSHKALLDDWFLPSLKDDFELVLECREQKCQGGVYRKDGWVDAVAYTADMVIRGIKENWGGYFIYSDVDIQFFRPIKKIVKELIVNNDMVIQKARPSGSPCSGFFVCRGNDRTLFLWEEIRRRLNDKAYREANPEDIGDQEELRKLIFESNPFNIVWRLLPDGFFTGGTLTGKQWYPGERLLLPKDIFLHHANWTIGMENKIAQLKYVKNVFDNRNK